MGRGLAAVLGTLLIVMVFVALVWVVVEVLAHRDARSRRAPRERTGPSWGEWFRGIADRKIKQQEAEDLARQERQAPWVAWERRDSTTDEWVIGIHRDPIGMAPPFDERELFRLPPDVDALTKAERYGDAIGTAADHEHRRQGGG